MERNYNPVVFWPLTVAKTPIFQRLTLPTTLVGYKIIYNLEETKPDFGGSSFHKLHT